MSEPREPASPRAPKLASLDEDVVLGRATCARCRRPESACFCAHLPVYTPGPRVVFLQHPRERRVPISTCRMAHLAFAGSELHHGVQFDGNPTLEALARDPEGAAVLFPGPGAIDPRTLRPGALRTLVVVDGTWSQARKLVERNRLLRHLPRLGLAPDRPSNYRIRREPAEHCVSTIEAVVAVLGLLDGDRDRYAGALGAFDYMIDRQIERRDAHDGPRRYRRLKVRQPKPLVPPELRDPSGHLVLVYVEANAEPGPSGEVGAPELLHLLAVRPSTGERFEAVVQPRRAMAESVPEHLELPRAVLDAGEPIEQARARWTAFSREDDVWCGWARFGWQLLGAEAFEPRHFVDLRAIVAKRLGRRSGGIEQARELLTPTAHGQWAPGRGGRRIAALEAVFGALLSDPPAGPRAEPRVGTRAPASTDSPT